MGYLDIARWKTVGLKCRRWLLLIADTLIPFARAQMLQMFTWFTRPQTDNLYRTDYKPLQTKVLMNEASDALKPRIFHGSKYYWFLPNYGYAFPKPLLQVVQIRGARLRLSQIEYTKANAEWLRKADTLFYESTLVVHSGVALRDRMLGALGGEMLYKKNMILRSGYALLSTGLQWTAMNRRFVSKVAELDNRLAGCCETGLPAVYRWDPLCAYIAYPFRKQEHYDGVRAPYVSNNTAVTLRDEARGMRPLPPPFPLPLGRLSTSRQVSQTQPAPGMAFAQCTARVDPYPISKPVSKPVELRAGPKGNSYVQRI